MSTRPLEESRYLEGYTLFIYIFSLLSKTFLNGNNILPGKSRFSSSWNKENLLLKGIQVCSLYHRSSIPKQMSIPPNKLPWFWRYLYSLASDIIGFARIWVSANAEIDWSMLLSIGPNSYSTNSAIISQEAPICEYCLLWWRRLCWLWWYCCSRHWEVTIYYRPCIILGNFFHELLSNPLDRQNTKYVLILLK